MLGMARRSLGQTGYRNNQAFIAALKMDAD
jgi:hypothetical protein